MRHQRFIRSNTVGVKKIVGIHFPLQRILLIMIINGNVYDITIELTTFEHQNKPKTMASDASKRFLQVFEVYRCVW